MQWLNEPLEWSYSGNRLIVKTSPKADFWRTTHYGFIPDSGHLDDTSEYRLFRLTYLPGNMIQAGIMCASPDGNGFEACFEGFPQ